MLIDAHHHFWRIGNNGCDWPTPAETMLYRDFMPEDFLAITRSLSVLGTVLVQAHPNDAGTDWLLKQADETQFVRAAVGWVDLLASNAAERIGHLAQNRKMRGLRPMLQNIVDDDWIANPALDPAIDAMVTHRLSLDALIFERHIPALMVLAKRRPDLPIVIDHAAKPQIGNVDAFSSWAEAMQMAADYPQIHCKLSGLPTLADPKADDSEYLPYVQHLIACFGSERLMWGSDWPVVELRTSYADWLTRAVRLSGLNGTALDELLHGTAKRFYRLEDR